jgi:hypothetical protein
MAANLCDVLKEDGFKVIACNRGDEGLRCASNGEWSGWFKVSYLK